MRAHSVSPYKYVLIVGPTGSLCEQLCESADMLAQSHDVNA